MNLYNFKFENTKESLGNLAIELNNKLLRDEQGHLLKNELFLCMLNNNPCTVYINTRNIIHIIMIEKARTHTEFILKNNKKHIADYVLKPFDTVYMSPKEIINKCYNVNLLGHEPVEIAV